MFLEGMLNFEKIKGHANYPMRRKQCVINTVIKLKADLPLVCLLAFQV